MSLLGRLMWWRKGWKSGPVIGLRSYSPHVPLFFEDLPAFDFPQDASGVDYVTQVCGPLAGKSQIRLRCRIDLADGAKLVPVDAPNQDPRLTLYFQRIGDDWSTKGEFEFYRWFACFAQVQHLGAGEYELVAPLDGEWTSALGRGRSDHPAEFTAALTEAHRVGFVFGFSAGAGHGVIARGTARFTCLEFTVS